MTLKVKKDGAWKEASSLKVKINGEWKDVATLYSKKDGAWITVYSSGALITFSSYPYPIPVAKGWQYSTDKVNWTTVSSDGTINESGSFTGYVKAKGNLTLNDFYTDTRDGDSVQSAGTHATLTPLVTNILISAGHAFGKGDKGYFVGGSYSNASNSESYRYAYISRYDVNGVKLSSIYCSSYATIAAVTQNDSKTYIFQYTYDETDEGSTNFRWYTKILDENDVLTSGAALGIRYTSSSPGESSTHNIYLFGGNTLYSYSNITAYVVKYDLNGVATTCTDLTEGREWIAVARAGDYIFCMGGSKGNINTEYLYRSAIDIYDKNDVKTTGALPKGSTYGSGVTHPNGYALYLAGATSGRYYDKYFGVAIDGSKNLTQLSGGNQLYDGGGFSLGTPGKDGGYGCTAGGIYFQSSSYSYPTNNVYTYDSHLNKSSFQALDDETYGKRSCTFANGTRAITAGGVSKDVSNQSLNLVEMYSIDYEKLYFTKLPITVGSIYTLNGTTATADTSKVLSYNSKVSGTIKYKKGTVPSS